MAARAASAPISRAARRTFGVARPPQRFHSASPPEGSHEPRDPVPKSLLRPCRERPIAMDAGRGGRSRCEQGDRILQEGPPAEHGMMPRSGAHTGARAGAVPRPGGRGMKGRHDQPPACRTAQSPLAHSSFSGRRHPRRLARMRQGRASARSCTALTAGCPGSGAARPGWRRRSRARWDRPAWAGAC
jgi:hypothetical protein